MTERRGTKALELWCRRITDGYPGVNVQNMTTSWKDGLAFCAMIHHFRPDLIDFNSLNKDDVYGNNELAFRTAAEHLGIPALLDAEDMASCSVPDRLSILTYLSQFYQCFGGSSPSRLALSRTKESTNEGITPVPESTTPKVGPRIGMRRDACAVCGMPIFLAEKLLISRTAYHRTCFRCARCKNQLTPGNYYETEDGEYCCETCPDEEIKESSTASVTDSFDQRQGSYNEAIFSEKIDGSKILNESELLERSLSDEEKSVRRRAQFSEEISRVTEEPPPPLPPPPTRKGTSIDDDNDDQCFIGKKEISRSAQLRLSNFINDQLLANNNEEGANSGLATQHDALSLLRCEAEDNRRRPKGSPISSKIGGKYVDDITPCRSNKDRPNSNGLGQHLEINDFSEFNDSVNDVAPAKSEESVDSNFRLVYNDYDQESSKEGPSSLENRDTSIGEDTKDNIGPGVDASGAAATRLVDESSIDEGESLSLVQRRLRMFESPKYDVTTNVNEARARSVTTSIAARDVENEKEAEIPPLSPPSIVEPTTTTTTRTIEEEEKLPPPVPKRSNLRARRDEKFKNNHNYADNDDDGGNTRVKVLAASRIDLSQEDNYPEDLNPFASDEEDNRDRREIDSSRQESRNDRVSTNPFGSSEDEDECDDNNDVVVTPLPAKRNLAKFIDDSPTNLHSNVVNEAPTKRLLKAPHINLNPFWSDEDEEHESDDENDTRCRSLNASTPVPRPRTIKQTADSAFSPSWKYRDSSRGDIYTSNSSLASASSTPGVGTCRKKKPAPPPPTIVKDSCDNSTAGSNNSLSTPRGKKTKAAPPPPLPTSAPPCLFVTDTDIATVADSPIIDNGKVQLEETRDYEIRRDPKYGKDEANRNTQSMVNVSRDEISPYDAYTDKSAQGKWKRKKGPAPARPTPHRRKIKVMSLKDVKLELDEIEMQQQGLEKQGVRLEQLIRDKAETGNCSQETSLAMDVEELVLELFALVNEKNELFRRQAELMLLRRQQRLEEEHADIEYQIRCLLCQPEATKTDFDKQREETLIQRLVEIVERRNEIVECLEMDRRREIEEDQSINTRMEIYAAKTKSELAKELEEEEAEERIKLKKSKKTKFKEKAREKILRKVHKKDADKDVDEAEVKLKRQNKKKWF